MQSKPNVFSCDTGYLRNYTLMECIHNLYECGQDSIIPVHNVLFALLCSLYKIIELQNLLDHMRHYFLTNDDWLVSTGLRPVKKTIMHLTHARTCTRAHTHTLTQLYL